MHDAFSPPPSTPPGVPRPTSGPDPSARAGGPYGPASRSAPWPQGRTRLRTPCFGQTAGGAAGGAAGGLRAGPCAALRAGPTRRRPGPAQRPCSCRPGSRARPAPGRKGPKTPWPRSENRPHSAHPPPSPNPLWKRGLSPALAGATWSAVPGGLPDRRSCSTHATRPDLAGAKADGLFLLDPAPRRQRPAYPRHPALPRDGTPWHGSYRGVGAGRTGRHQEAEADFTRAIALDAGQATAYANRGVARSQMGDVRGMCVDYGRACALGAMPTPEGREAMDYCREP